MTAPAHGCVLDDVLRHRVVPVVTLDDPDPAPDLAAVLVAGGLPVAELTLRSPRALAVLARLAADPALLVGAGTVLTPGQVDRARDAGARFVVSPGFAVDVVDRARELGLPVLPGIATAGELQAAVRHGVGAVKFFPAAAAGGVPMVAALAAPFPDVRFVPTGGITAASAPGYLAHPSVAAVGGSWMVPAPALAAGDWERVRTLCAEAVRR